VEGRDLCLPQRETGVMLCMYLLENHISFYSIYASKSYAISYGKSYARGFSAGSNLKPSDPAEN
jgi:hypothetical protein